MAKEKKKIPTRESVTFPNVVNIVTMAIACLSLYLSYSLLSIVRVEKGFDTDPQIALSLMSWTNGDVELTIQNMSNTSISINAVYFLKFVVEGPNKVKYDGRMFDFKYSEANIDPYGAMKRTMEHFMDRDNSLTAWISSVKREDAASTIVEARVYYSRSIDGKQFGIRSFYGFEGGFLLVDEERLAHANKTLASSISLGYLPGDREGRLEEDKAELKQQQMILGVIKKMVDDDFYEKIETDREPVPGLKQIAPNNDKWYEIEF